MRDIQPTAASRDGRPGVWVLPNTEIYELSKQLGLISDETWLKTDKTPYFTGEYSENELLAFPRQFNLGMARGRGWLMYLGELLRERVPRPVKRILRAGRRRFIQRIGYLH
jgi:hypothetical protein